MGEFKDAIQAFGVVIRMLPDFTQAYHGRAVAYYRDGQVDLALEDLDRAIELDPDFADAYRDRAVAHAEQGDTANAAADLETALGLYDPKRDAEKLADVRALLGQLRR